MQSKCHYVYELAIGPSWVGACGRGLAYFLLLGNMPDLDVLFATRFLREIDLAALKFFDFRLDGATSDLAVGPGAELFQPVIEKPFEPADTEVGDLATDDLPPTREAVFGMVIVEMTELATPTAPAVVLPFLDGPFLLLTRFLL